MKNGIKLTPRGNELLKLIKNFDDNLNVFLK